MSEPKNPYTGAPSLYPPSMFSTSMSGTCLCKAIAVTISDSALFTTRRGHLCHCSNCRKISGSYVAANFVIEKEKVEVKDREGTLKKFEDWETGSGNVVIRGFCGRCGCPVFSESAITPDKIILKMGLFPRIPAPEAESFAEHRHEWQGKHDGVVQFATVRGGRRLGG
ncbi:uncharacterized protein BDR25DRAFT_289404 [Lindgomyces ingoldianus]|uniref:Uncharacterized protein n=1 Tax=Lindgomyces ingoldianus TaxID=673940 RepID=A0ACB6QQ78_9PLEO|nr:uncharacterized protein BDR25DRAFT_289404 [Lindgomyces ingoldianus]KAF2469174.1 hypothetical protein BDR25DRAFT_289404 [Lindgomyces ingoldianus]